MCVRSLSHVIPRCLCVGVRAQMPAELLVEEALEHILVLAKRALVNNDKAPSKPSAPGTAPTKTPAVVGKRGGGAKAAKSNQPTAEGPTAGATLTLLLERMAFLAGSGLADSLMHQLLQVGLRAAFGAAGAASASAHRRDSLPLQMAGLRVIVSVFAEHPAQRRGIITDMLDARLHATLTPSREQRKNYVLPDGARVQLFSALCLLLVQKSAALPEAPPPPEPEPPAAAPEASTTPGRCAAQGSRLWSLTIEFAADLPCSLGVGSVLARWLGQRR